MERIRYGMVGGGEGAFIGAVHRMAARLDDAWELVCGAFSSDAARSLRSGEELGLPPKRVYENYMRMMANESMLHADDRMQVVVIVTPNRSHLPIALAAIERGFHVLSDKPATGLAGGMPPACRRAAGQRLALWTHASLQRLPHGPRGARARGAWRAG